MHRGNVAAMRQRLPGSVHVLSGATTSRTCRSESIRTGFLLSQGGEFAFVLLSLANTLKILPEDLNQVGHGGWLPAIAACIHRCSFLAAGAAHLGSSDDALRTRAVMF